MERVQHSKLLYLIYLDCCGLRPRCECAITLIGLYHFSCLPAADKSVMLFCASVVLPSAASMHMRRVHKAHVTEHICSPGVTFCLPEALLLNTLPRCAR